MLNEFLYKSLKAQFGDVAVENEGQHADLELDQSFGTTGWRLSETGSHGEQYRVDCPFCGDHRKHLYISYLSYARPVVNGEELCTGPLRAHCFRRNCLASKDAFMSLQSMIGMGMSMVGDGLVNSAPVDMSSSTDDDTPADAPSDSATVEGIHTWVPDYRKVDQDASPEVLEYLKARGISQEDIDGFGIGWGQVFTPRTHRPINNGAPHVIFPIIMNGKLVGVQARCPDALLNGSKMKYWFHPGTRKRAILYNLDTARQYGIAVLCEGIFDVLHVGGPGVCCFGHTLSPAQSALLSGLRCVVLLPDTDPHPDFDTVENARTLAAQWNAEQRFQYGAHVVVLPAKDAGELPRREIWKEILGQAGENAQDYIMNKVLQQ